VATRDELYAKFGRAAEAAQLFETDLGTMLLALEAFKMGWHRSLDPELAAKFYGAVNRKTLGQLLASVREHVTFDEIVQTKFQSALVARNRLNHSFFQHHNLAIQNVDGREKMIADLEELHTELFQAWQIAQKLAELLTEKLKSD
jgi:hypothetical protein